QFQPLPFFRGQQPRRARQRSVQSSSQFHAPSEAARPYPYCYPTRRTRQSPNATYHGAQPLSPAAPLQSRPCRVLPVQPIAAASQRRWSSRRLCSTLTLAAFLSTLRLVIILCRFFAPL